MGKCESNCILNFTLLLFSSHQRLYLVGNYVNVMGFGDSEVPFFFFKCPHKTSCKHLCLHVLTIAVV